MTIGISKERLEEILQSNQCTFEREILDEIIKECTELNPWLPIEQAPKDRQVLLYVDKGPESYRQWVGYADNNWPWLPTHWQELPGEPE